MQDHETIKKRKNHCAPLEIQDKIQDIIQERELKEDHLKKRSNYRLGQKARELVISIIFCLMQIRARKISIDSSFAISATHTSYARRN